MSVRKWRVIVTHVSGRRWRYGCRSMRGQGYPFVSERAARNYAALLEADEHVECCEVEEFDYIPPPPPYVSPLSSRGR